MGDDGEQLIEEINVWLQFVNYDPGYSGYLNSLRNVVLNSRRYPR